MTASNTFTSTERRPHTEGLFHRHELAHANRNYGILLEALRYDVTPTGLHYLLNHFDVPYTAVASDWRVAIGGRVRNPGHVLLDEIKRLPARTLRVTMECAGNGRSVMTPRYPSIPWAYEAVGTAEWTGTPLRHVLDRAGLLDDVVDIAFIGADRGFDRGQEHDYGRSLKPEVALSEDVLLVWAMNGAPLLPQHGAPLRLIVPGWYGMASVKWLERIEVLDRRYEGFQQVATYHYKPTLDAVGIPVTHIRVKSLLVPPGIPDLYTRFRMVEAGAVPLFGRAWSGDGVPIARVEVGVDGVWHDAQLEQPPERFAWTAWRFTWNAAPGEHELACRATDANGETQPLEPRWDTGGFGNNVVHRVQVVVR